MKTSTRLLFSQVVTQVACFVSTEHHKYCIVGAGPAGVQLGHFLKSAGRDYVILEQAPRAASWFSKFPIHRRLNSINRRYTRRNNLEYNLRHDWNSLLGAEDTIGLFGNWSQEYWPPADTLVEYINAFAAPQVDAGLLQFNQHVGEIEKCSSESTPSGSECRYMLSVATLQSSERAESCPAKSSAGACDEAGFAQEVSRLEGIVGDLQKTVQEGDLSTETLQALIAARARVEAAQKNVKARKVSAKSHKHPPQRHISCSVLIMANGMHKPRVVTDWIEGLADVATRYDDLQKISIDSFENRSVLILGNGNAAQETADAVRNVARDITISGRGRVTRNMGDSRYVGDVRAHRTTIRDTFNLKSYEAELTVKPGSELNLIMVPCGPDENNLGFLGKPPTCVFVPTVHPDHGEVIPLVPLDEVHRPLAEEAKRVFPSAEFFESDDQHMKFVRKIIRRIKGTFQPLKSRVLYMSKASLMREMTLEQRRLLIRLRDSGSEMAENGEELRYPYDVVITALGWEYNHSAFGKSVQLDMMGSTDRPNSSNQYPKLNSEFESVSARHLFFAGAAAHGLDRYRYKASGGFIHGFRFNCRSLWRILEERYESEPHSRTKPIAVDGTIGVDWNPSKLHQPSRDQELMTGNISSMSPLWRKLVERINTAAGPYEMVGGSLVDSIIYDCAAQKAWYTEDIPEDLVHDRYNAHPRLTWGYYYGASGYDSNWCGKRVAASGVFSSFIHPVLQYFSPGFFTVGGIKKMPSELHHDKYFDLQKHGAIDPMEHPSVAWSNISLVRRMHIKEAWIYSDWADPKSVRPVQLFMSHIEYAAADFCLGRGKGLPERMFDERIDVHMLNPHFMEKVGQKTQCEV